MGGGIVEFWPPSPSRPSVTFSPLAPILALVICISAQKRDSDAVLTVPETPATGNRQLLDALPWSRFRILISVASCLALLPTRRMQKRTESTPCGR